MVIKKYFFILIIIALGIACQSPDSTKTPVIPGEPIYAEYKIWGTEESEFVNIFMQFREENKDGKVLMIEPPGNITLDQQIVVADSARMTGAFYEMQVPSNTFAGKHEVVFTDKYQNKHIEFFNWMPFRLETNLLENKKRGEWDLQVSGVENNEKLRLIIVDTSFASPDINDIYTVTDGQIRITEQALRNVKDGPVTLELLKEVEKGIKGSGPVKGTITITYSLRRDFELVQ